MTFFHEKEILNFEVEDGYFIEFELTSKNEIYVHNLRVSTDSFLVKLYTESQIKKKDRRKAKKEMFTQEGIEFIKKEIKNNNPEIFL